MSQTHATAILPDIAERLGSLASNLHNTEIPIQILLHPEEVRTGHPYPEHLRPLLSKPPHALSTGDSKPWLVVGLLSTALLEMAERGHYVAGLDDTINGQEAAAAVGRPPVQVTDSAGIEALFHALAVPAAQSAMREELVSWLNRVFAQTSHPLAASLLAEDL
ncbi:MAG: hypothetical protein KKB63_06290 [Alphaproteobacteria bacterium]|nr:hypothetical protein [Alphaproteobacteria bacterium]